MCLTHFSALTNVARGRCSRRALTFTKDSTLRTLSAKIKMTRPKKWFMDDSEGSGRGVVLKNADGLLKKPNASQPLGRVSSVTVADADSSKYPQSVQVH